MTRLCNFPISETKRCTQPIADNRPNCGRHHCEISADQLIAAPVVYREDGVLHVWAGEPDSAYCLIHSDPAYQAMCQLVSHTELAPCAGGITNQTEVPDDTQPDDPPNAVYASGEQNWYDERGGRHRKNGPAVIAPDGTPYWYWHGVQVSESDHAMYRAKEQAEADRCSKDGISYELTPGGTQHWTDKDGREHRDDGPATIWQGGAQEWYQHGVLHRDGGPAITESNGAKEWYQHGELHREDGPAKTRPGGGQWWYQHDKLHRDDGPAVIESDGTEEWYQHGKLHRDGGPAVVEADDTQKWYQNGKQHRDDGPAVIKADGTQRWYQHGELHRDDGPAAIKADGTQRWYQHGQLHRADGPAVTNSPRGDQFWWHGRQVESQQQLDELYAIEQAVIAARNN